MKSAIVIDAGYGNSGIGLVVDWLSNTFEYNVIARYCGGPQAANLVKYKAVPNGREITHQFEVFGSGSLAGIKTVLLPEVVFDPILLWKEYLALKEVMKCIPSIVIDYHCPVITPYEVYLNQNSTKALEDGTSGKGVFATKQRELNHHHIHAIDLLYPEILEFKLKELRKIYHFPLKLENSDKLYDVDLTEFFHCVKEITSNKKIFRISKYEWNSLKNDTDIIFESSQGLMIDERIGIFPHCTPSKVDIPEDCEIEDIYVVIKAYHTREGNGPITSDPNSLELKNKVSSKAKVLDLDILLYALESSNISEYLLKNKEAKLHLVITHLKDVEGNYKLKCTGYENGYKEFSALYGFVEAIIDKIKICDIQYYMKLCNTFLAYTDFKEDITKFVEIGEIKERVRRERNIPSPIEPISTSTIIDHNNWRMAEPMLESAASVLLANTREIQGNLVVNGEIQDNLVATGEIGSRNPDDFIREENRADDRVVNTNYQINDEGYVISRN